MTQQTTVNNDTAGNGNPPAKGWLAVVPYIIAIGVLIAYGFFIHYLLKKVGIGEPDWSQMIYLFSGVEAIVFAAAGFLFGREVNRKRAETAEQEKKLAEIKKEEAKEQAADERKKALILGAMAIQEERTSSRTTDKGALEGMTAKSMQAGSIADTARRMYPELND